MSKKQLEYGPDEGDDELDAGSWPHSEASGSATGATARISKATAGNERQARKVAQQPKLSLVTTPAGAHSVTNAANVGFAKAPAVAPAPAISNNAFAGIGRPAAGKEQQQPVRSEYVSAAVAA
eukprot:CAMPEP_0172914598 /NCGR_PEP_ID=MMETSP1075-20121228/192714_1 /TAXON_ID=2916 /ORGANISM="Ceratium fusus, Strain PA161109" /LENGTH=122 /DNA_ID=CAMNT_0013773541 /DNA_START=84 /DNA_END=448 /DNA_ORIENTATION=+